MNTKEWVIVIVAVIVVAVVSSLVTVSMTGNVININRDRWGKYKVYTVDDFNSGIPLLVSGDSAKFRDVNFVGGSVSNDWIVGYYLQAQKLLVQEDLTTQNMYGKGIILTDNASPYLMKTTTINGQGIMINNVNIQTMIGNGTAYACVDALGNLFRSSTDC